MQLLIYIPAWFISFHPLISSKQLLQQRVQHWFSLMLRHGFFVKLWVKHTQLRSFWQQKLDNHDCNESANPAVSLQLGLFQSSAGSTFSQHQDTWKHMPAISSDWNKCGTSLHRLHQPLPRLWICGWSEKNIFVFVWELQEVNAHRGFTVGHLPLVNLQKSGTRSPQIQKCRHSSRTQCAPNEQTNSGRLFVAPGKVVSAFLLSACDPLSWMAKTYTVWTKQYWGST